MTWFRRPSELTGMLEFAGQDEKKLAGLHGKLDALQQEWEEIQSECERIEALRDSSSGTYAVEVCEPFWTARAGKLRDSLLAAVAKRDALTGVVCAEIADLKRKVDGRNGALVSVFSRWIGQIPADSPVRAELEKLRGEVRSLKSAASIVDRISAAVKVVESDKSGQHLPLLNYEALVRAFNEV